MGIFYLAVIYLCSVLSNENIGLAEAGDTENIEKVGIWQ